MRVFLPLLLTLFSVNLSAQTIYCTGKISSTYISKDGNVYINGAWRGSWTKVCNTKDVDVVTCSLWTSYAMSAVQNNLDMTLRYIVSDEGITCANLPTYNKSPKPEYLMLRNSN